LLSEAGERLQFALRYHEEMEMLHAINSGKAGRIRIEGLEQSISWRKVFKENEDPLTAVVFTRLSYIPGEMAWRILRRNASPLHDLPDSLGELDGVLFWPKLNAESLARLYVEPDAILNFKDGTVLVEAKGSDSELQYAKQWAEELATCVSNPEQDGGLPVYLLAIGGIERLSNEWIAQKAKEVQQIARERELMLPQRWISVGCTLQGLRDSIALELRMLSSAETAIERILKDMLMAFDLYGLRSTSWLTDLPGELKMWPRLNYRSANTLSSWLPLLPFSTRRRFKSMEGITGLTAGYSAISLRSFTTLDEWRVNNEPKG
jgi:hypothetical protein